MQRDGHTPPPPQPPQPWTLGPDEVAELRERHERFTAELPERLLKLREDRHWTQKEVADRLAELGGRELDPTAVLRIEKGRRRVQFDEVWLFAAVFGVGLDALAPPPVVRREGDPVSRQAIDRLSELVERIARAADAQKEAAGEQRAAAAEAGQALAQMWLAVDEHREEEQ